MSDAPLLEVEEPAPLGAHRRGPGADPRPRRADAAARAASSAWSASRAAASPRWRAPSSASSPRRATIESGEILLEGENLLGLERPRDDAARARPPHRLHPAGPLSGAQPRIQDRLPAAGGAALARAAATLRTERDRRAHLVSLLRRVQIPEPEAVLERYPHQFSGGQRQRLMIAGALACSPALVIADEPTTALDVTTQLQILKLLKIADRGVRHRRMLFVTHDFGVVAQLCDAITVMYAGQTVEAGPTRRVLADPAPSLHARAARLPSRPLRCARPASRAWCPRRSAPPPGCRFTPRCTHAAEVCSRRLPRLVADAAGPSRQLPARRRALRRRGSARMRPAPSHPGGARRRRPARRPEAVAAAGRAAGAGRGWRVPVAARRRDAGAGRRIRLRQDHARAHAAGHPARDRAARSASTARVVSGLPRERARHAGAPCSTCTRTPAPRSIPGGASAASWRKG